MASGHRTTTHFRPETSPGTDPLVTALAINFIEPTSFQEQSHLRLKSHNWIQTSSPGERHSPWTLGKSHPLPFWAKDDEFSGHLPVMPLDCHLFPPSPFLFPLIFFHFKNIQLCLGDEQNEMSLTYKKERQKRKPCITLHTSSLKSRPASDFETVTISEYYFSSYLSIFNEPQNFARCPSPEPSLPS